MTYLIDSVRARVHERSKIHIAFSFLLWYTNILEKQNVTIKQNLKKTSNKFNPMSRHATHLSPNILYSQGYNDEIILLHGKVWEHWAVHKRNLTTPWMYGKFGNKCVQKARTASLASTLSSWKDRNNKKISWTITRCSTQKKTLRELNSRQESITIY